jgi:hypothetical protein
MKTEDMQRGWAFEAKPKPKPKLNFFNYRRRKVKEAEERIIKDRD